MSRSYSIKKVEIVDDPVFLKVAKLEVFDKKIENFTRSVDRYTYKKTLECSLREFDSLINEIHIRMDLETLRKIDNDPDEQKKFIYRNVRFLDYKKLINIFLLKIIIKKNEKIEKKDLEYINSLLLYQLNDIYVVPILEFEGEIDKPTRVQIYNKFVEELLKEKNTVNPNLRIAISIPSYYPRRRLDSLFSLYEIENKEPTFIVVDFAYQRATDPSRIGIIPTINSYFLENNNEKYFIYGFNVKPYKKGEQTPLSEEIMLIESGFNAVGAPYKNKKIKLAFSPRTWDHLNKIFQNTDYKYHPLSEKDKRLLLENWLQQFLEFNVNLKEVKSTVNKYVRQYNFYSLNKEFLQISEKIWKSELEVLEEQILNKEVTLKANELAKKILKNKPKSNKHDITLDKFI
ncbi:hypothetical protein GAH_00771 [Geoglobus ahangari]|uniref:Uncharacterized protein n=1 Tax=Geoglobus ahangari TaxID=113653 RepID=A0A0F7IIM3_9EURY|nr:hypothetical protein [Geoglobus ahangari]AKG91894.1 hypothetical protein GAH_00771 [Geoglobus ahangari]